MRNKKALLAYGYSAKNAGDLAICLGAIDLLVQEGYDVTLLSKYDRSDPEFLSSKEYYEKRYSGSVEVLEAPFTLNRNESLLKKAYHNMKGLLVFLGVPNKQDRIVKKAIENSSYVIFNGGNLLRCSSFIDYVRLVALYYPIRLARKFNKDVIIFPHSSATINSLGKGIISKILNSAKIVFAREQISYRKLKSDFGLSNIYNSIDLAFFINNGLDIKQKRETEPDEKSIGFTFRSHTVGDIGEFGAVEKNKIKDKVFSVLDLYGNDYKYYFVIQTQKDREFTTYMKEEVERRYGYKISIFENYDPIVLIDFYRGLQLLVGMRLHSIILAASVGTPAFGLFFDEWGLKNPGLMEKLELPYAMLDNAKDLDQSELENVINSKVEFSDRVATLIEQEKAKLINALK